MTDSAEGLMPETPMDAYPDTPEKILARLDAGSWDETLVRESAKLIRDLERRLGEFHRVQTALVGVLGEGSTDEDWAECATRIVAQRDAEQGANLRLLQKCENLNAMANADSGKISALEIKLDAERARADLHMKRAGEYASQLESAHEALAAQSLLLEAAEKERDFQSRNHLKAQESMLEQGKEFAAAEERAAALQGKLALETHRAEGWLERAAAMESALGPIVAVLGMAEWGSAEYAESIFLDLIEKHYANARSALAARRPA